jgi:hypothetical protein
MRIRQAFPPDGSTPYFLCHLGDRTSISVIQMHLYRQTVKSRGFRPARRYLCCAARSNGHRHREAQGQPDFSIARPPRLGEAMRTRTSELQNSRRRGSSQVRNVSLLSSVHASHTVRAGGRCIQGTKRPGKEHPGKRASREAGIQGRTIQDGPQDAPLAPDRRLHRTLRLALRVRYRSEGEDRAWPVIFPRSS